MPVHSYSIGERDLGPGTTAQMFTVPDHQVQ